MATALSQKATLRFVVILELCQTAKMLEVREVILIDHSSMQKKQIYHEYTAQQISYSNFCVRSRRISGSWVFPSPKRHHRLAWNCTIRLQSSCFRMSDLRSSKLLKGLQRNFLLEHCCLFWIFSGLEILGVNSVSAGVLPDSFAAIQVREIGFPCEVFRLLRYVEITDCRIYAPAVWRVPRAKEMFEKFEDEAPVTNMYCRLLRANDEKWVALNAWL